MLVIFVHRFSSGPVDCLKCRKFVSSLKFVFKYYLEKNHAETAYKVIDTKQLPCAENKKTFATWYSNKTPGLVLVLFSSAASNQVQARQQQ